MKATNFLLDLISAFFRLGITNVAGGFVADVEAFIQEEVEPLARRQLVAYQFGAPLRLDINRGTTYTASRYERLNLPFAALQEGVAPAGESMTLSQVSATAQQWGDLVRVTDVANLTIKHPLFQQAIQLVSLQMPETLERNTFNTLMAGNQVNFVNSRASRALLVSTDVLSPTEVYRAVGSMEAFGVPHFMGDERTDIMKEAGARKDMSRSPATMEHYVALIHPLPVNDMKQNATVANAWSQSDINRLYNNDIGEWGGVRFCKSNMIPFFVGQADPGILTPSTYVASGVGGNLAGGNFFVQITSAPAQTSVERNIFQVSQAIAVPAGTTGSITVTLPTTAGFVFNVYIGTSASPTNLGLSVSGPASGPLAGQATQLASGSTVIITGIGAAQTPPAAPATGITVFPTIILGDHSYGQVLLENPEFHYLTGADKSDPLNQTRVVSWKMFYGSIILNQAFFMRVESSSAFTPGYNQGTQTIGVGA